MCCIVLHIARRAGEQYNYNYIHNSIITGLTFLAFYMKCANDGDIQKSENIKSKQNVFIFANQIKKLDFKNVSD